MKRVRITFATKYPIPPPIGGVNDPITKTGPWWDWYNTYLKSIYWKVKRRWALRAAGYKCSKCGACHCVLQVHHLTYERVGCEKLTDLEVRCVACHGADHPVLVKTPVHIPSMFAEQRFTRKPLRKQEPPIQKIYRLYAAGKIKKNDWRGRGRSLLDEDIFFDEFRLDRVSSTAVTVNYVGPFFMSCDHGCAHGPNQHGLYGVECGCGFYVGRSEVAQRCLEQIAKCDLFYVRLGDADDAYGTLVEIGYAAALGKPIYPDIVQGAKLNDMWFAIHMALQSPMRAEHLPLIPYWTQQPASLTAYRESLQCILNRPKQYPTRAMLGLADPIKGFEEDLPEGLEEVEPECTCGNSHGFHNSDCACFSDEDYPYDEDTYRAQLREAEALETVCATLKSLPIHLWGRDGMTYIGYQSVLGWEAWPMVVRDAPSSTCIPCLACSRDLAQETVFLGDNEGALCVSCFATYMAREDHVARLNEDEPPMEWSRVESMDFLPKGPEPELTEDGI